MVYVINNAITIQANLKITCIHNRAFKGMQSERGISSLAECTENIAGFLEVLQLNWNTDDLRLADSLLTTLENYFRLFHFFDWTHIR